MYPGDQPNYNYQQQGNWGNPNIINYGQPTFGNQMNVDTFNGFKIYDEFKIKEKLLTIGMDMKLQLDGQQFGFIKQKVFSFGAQFDLLDNNGTVVATAKEKVFQIGRDFEIYDNIGMKIGSITEQVLKSLFSIHRKYTVRDANGMQVGSTKQLDIGNRAAIQIFNEMGSTQAQFSEQWLSFVRQKWNVRFYGFNIDRRLLIFFPSISSQRQEIKH